MPVEPTHCQEFGHRWLEIRSYQGHLRIRCQNCHDTKIETPRDRNDRRLKEKQANCRHWFNCCRPSKRDPLQAVCEKCGIIDTPDYGEGYNDGTMAPED